MRWGWRPERCSAPSPASGEPGRCLREQVTAATAGQGRSARAGVRGCGLALGSSSALAAAGRAGGIRSGQHAWRPRLRSLFPPLARAAAPGRRGSSARGAGCAGAPAAPCGSGASACPGVPAPRWVCMCGRPTRRQRCPDPEALAAAVSAEPRPALARPL